MNKLNDLALALYEERKKLGYTTLCNTSQYRDKYFPAVTFFEVNNLEEFNDENAQKYRDYICGRADKNEIGTSRYHQLLSGLDDLLYFRDTGKVRWPYPRKRDKFRLNSYFQDVEDRFLKSEDFHPNTRGDIIWICDDYFGWLEHQGYEDLSKVDVDVIQRYIKMKAESLLPTSLYNVRIYIKKLYAFLHSVGLSDSDYALLFEFRVNRSRPLSPAADPDEVDKTLKVIDRNTVQGKRDYAMFLLGKDYGMRAGDIIHLKLTDIDWGNGEIHKLQGKTDKPLVLPLIKEVGEAIKTYILNGRPDCNCKEIFICMHAPYHPFVDCTGIEYLYSKYRRKAGFSRKAFDGKGFHSLRRAAGKNLITSGIPVNTVAEILGHSNINSVRKYVSLDAVHLKECALGFKGIEVSR